MSGRWASVAFGARSFEEVDLGGDNVRGREERKGGR